MKNQQDTTPEILYVSASSLDNKGRRVVVCDGMVQNILWPEDGVTDVDMRLLGVTSNDKTDIETFFEGISRRMRLE